MDNIQFEMVTLGTKHYVGVPVTNVFNRFNPELMKEANEIFNSRIREIKRIIHEHEYVCPHFANDIMFTYVYCMEVSEIEDVPKGMIGFHVPSQRYVKVRAVDQDPYESAKLYLEANGLENNTRALALEVFRFGEEQHFNHADIYIPIR
jgi:Uncharacterized protein conserved in bacteria